MEIFFLILFLTGTVFISCSNGQTSPDAPAKSSQNKASEIFEFTLETAHPKAQGLMQEKFYWSPIEETAPFGSDDGRDAAYEFRDWRKLHKGTSPVRYINDLIKSWDYPPFDYLELDTAKIKDFIISNSTVSES